MSMNDLEKKRMEICNAHYVPLQIRYKLTTEL